MRNRTALWAGVFAGLGWLDFWLDRRHDGSTFSEVTRHWFRTDTPTGRTVFTLALTGGGFVFHQHIVRGECPWAPCSTS